eukprot:m.79247 g.79247  ORF g.79247 m.79247 type:complete len:348 (+) comp8177_c2_seq1:719-1762(+)
MSFAWRWHAQCANSTSPHLHQGAAWRQAILRATRRSDFAQRRPHDASFPRVFFHRLRRGTPATRRLHRRRRGSSTLQPSSRSWWGMPPRRQTSQRGPPHRQISLKMQPQSQARRRQRVAQAWHRWHWTHPTHPSATQQTVHSSRKWSTSLAMLPFTAMTALTRESFSRPAAASSRFSTRWARQRLRPSRATLTATSASFRVTLTRIQCASIRSSHLYCRKLTQTLWQQVGLPPTLSYGSSAPLSLSTSCSLRWSWGQKQLWQQQQRRTSRRSNSITTGLCAASSLLLLARFLTVMTFSALSGPPRRKLSLETWPNSHGRSRHTSLSSTHSTKATISRSKCIFETHCW